MNPSLFLVPGAMEVAVFPLTPALSHRERENRKTVLRETRGGRVQLAPRRASCLFRLGYSGDTALDQAFGNGIAG